MLASSRSRIYGRNLTQASMKNSLAFRDGSIYGRNVSVEHRPFFPQGISPCTRPHKAPSRHALGSQGAQHTPGHGGPRVSGCGLRVLLVLERLQFGVDRAQTPLTGDLPATPAPQGDTTGRGTARGRRRCAPGRCASDGCWVAGPPHGVPLARWRSRGGRLWPQRGMPHLSSCPWAGQERSGAQPARRDPPRSVVIVHGSGPWGEGAGIACRGHTATEARWEEWQCRPVSVSRLVLGAHGDLRGDRS